MAAADTAKLIASLELQDKFTGVAKKAQASIGGLEKNLDSLGSTAARGARVAAASLAAIGVGAGIAIATQVKFGIDALSRLEEVTNATNAVITSTGGAAGVTAAKVRELANSTEDLTTVDDKVVQSGENLLLTFTNIGASIFPQATKAMTDMAIAMAQGNVESADLKGTAIQLGKALQDPVAGMTALRRSGVSFSADQQKVIKDLVKTGDLLGAQKLILTEVEKEFGKAGAAAGTGYTADMRRLGDAVEEAQMALATGLLPAIQEVARWLNTKLRDPQTMAAIKEAGQQLAVFLEQALAAVQKIPWGSVINAMKGAAGVAKTILDAFLGLPDWVKTAVITGWGLNKLTGGALNDIVGSLASGLIKGVLGITAAVVNINAGVVKGGPGTPSTPSAPAGGGGKAPVETPGGGGLKVTPPGEGGGGIKDSIGNALKSPLAIFTAVAVALGTLLKGDTAATENNSAYIKDLQTMVAQGRGNEKVSNTETAQQALDAILGKLPTPGDLRLAAQQEATWKATVGALAASEHSDAEKTQATVAHKLDALHADFVANRKVLNDQTAALKERVAAAGKVAGDVTKGVGNIGQTKATLDSLLALRKAVVASGDKKLLAALDASIRAVRAKIAPRTVVDQQLDKMKGILASSKTSAQKIAELKSVQAAIGNRSKTATDQVRAAIERLKMHVSITVPVTVNATTSIRASQDKIIIANRYGAIARGSASAVL